MDAKCVKNGCSEIAAAYTLRKNFKYLYTVGLLSPHTRASSDTFILPSIKMA